MKNFGDKDAGQDSVYNWRAKNLTRCQQVGNKIEFLAV